MFSNICINRYFYYHQLKTRFVLVEAAASNKLILSSNVLSGPKEFLYNKSSGFLFEKENIIEF